MPQPQAARDEPSLMSAPRVAKRRRPVCVHARLLALNVVDALANVVVLGHVLLQLRVNVAQLLWARDKTHRVRLGSAFVRRASHTGWVGEGGPRLRTFWMRSVRSRMLFLTGYLASFHWNDSRYLSSGPAKRCAAVVVLPRPRP